LLVRYGYSLLDSASITLLFRFFEFWIPLVLGLFSFLTKRGNILLRVLPVIIIFSLGVTNIVSTLTPAIPSRIHLVETLFSSDIAQISNFTVLVFGIILIILSVYLFKGAKNAWRAALIISFASIIGHLVKAIDFEEASIAMIAFISLLINRKSYFVKHDISVQRRSFSTVLIAIGAMYIYTVLGFYFLHEHNFGIDFNLKESLVIFFRIFVLFETSVLVPHTLFAKGFIYSIYLSGGAILIYTIYILFKPSKKEISTSDESKTLAERLVNEFGNSSLDYFKTYPDKLLFFNNAQDCFLSYRITDKYAVVLETPVGLENSLKQIIVEFESYCNSVGLKAFYYRVPDESLQIFHELKMSSLRVGQEAIVDLTNFSLSGKEMKPIRNAINKTSESGFTFHVYQPPVKGGFIQKLELVSNEWLEENGREEIAFTQGVFKEEIIKNSTIVSVEDNEEKVVAFANLVPAYAPGEATYDMLRKIKDAPNGVLDFLMINLFEYLKGQGFKTVNLGLAPLAGIDKAENFNERVIKFLRDNLRQTSRFKGLYHFKDKFDPIWKDKYLVYHEAYDLIQFPAVLNEVSKSSI
jgi:phosphatidylglycerol lysyltransferase